MFKSRVGPLKVFEAGEYHNIKGFKVAVCSYQIETRKVLDRDNLKGQTAAVSSHKQKRAAQPAKVKPGTTFVFHEEQSQSQIIGTQNQMHGNQTSFASGKGSHNDSTMNTRHLSRRDFQQDNGDSSMFEGDAALCSNDQLLAEIMQEIKMLEMANQQQGEGNQDQVIPSGENLNSTKPSSLQTTSLSKKSQQFHKPANQLKDQASYNNTMTYFGNNYYPEMHDGEGQNYTNFNGNGKFTEQNSKVPPCYASNEGYHFDKLNNASRPRGTTVYCNGNPTKANFYGMLSSPELQSQDYYAEGFMKKSKMDGGQLKKKGSLQENTWMNQIEAEEDPVLLWDDGEEHYAEQ